MKRLLALACVPLALVACGGQSKEVVEVPTDMPEICRGIDFVTQPDMREVCGVRASRYKSYKNIPMQRYLIVPKGASLVKESKKIELRLPNTLPIPLEGEWPALIDFSAESRTEFIKNKMEYKELFPPGQDRIKIFKLDIPLTNGHTENLCFNVPDIEVDAKKRSHASNRVESMSCVDYSNIVAKYGT